MLPPVLILQESRIKGGPIFGGQANMLNMFKGEEFKSRWEQVSQFYPKDFREFVNGGLAEQKASES
jgi:hypothetical protein